jgi:hypothetical protein
VRVGGSVRITISGHDPTPPPPPAPVDTVAPDSTAEPAPEEPAPAPAPPPNPEARKEIALRGSAALREMPLRSSMNR